MQNDFPAINFVPLDMEEENAESPRPTKIEDVRLEDGQTVRMIHVDTEVYARELKIVKAREAALKSENPIKYARQEAGLTLKELATLIGAPYATVLDWNSGRRTPPPWIARLVVEKIQASV